MKSLNIVMDENVDLNITYNGTVYFFSTTLIQDAVLEGHACVIKYDEDKRIEFKIVNDVVSLELFFNGTFTCVCMPDMDILKWYVTNMAKGLIGNALQCTRVLMTLNRWATSHSVAARKAIKNVLKAQAQSNEIKMIQTVLEY